MVPPLKYEVPLAIAQEVYNQQHQLVASLRTLRNILDSNIQEARDPQSEDGGLILRMTVLSALIHTSCALTPHETAYDAHELSFRCIVADGEAVLVSNSAKIPSSSPKNQWHQFTMGPGVVEPLFTTACKCRHPVVRRRAIDQLSMAGREGPWYGPREARIMSRIMELEECHDFPIDPPSASSDIGELQRINEVGFSSAPKALSLSTNVIVRFSRCHSRKHRPQVHPHDDDREEFETSDNSLSGLVWERWIEQLEF